MLAKAKDWAKQLGKPVELWMSDKQDAFVKGIEAEFPDVPHRYCANHFLRDVAQEAIAQERRSGEDANGGGDDVLHGRAVRRTGSSTGDSG